MKEERKVYVQGDIVLVKSTANRGFMQDACSGYVYARKNDDNSVSVITETGEDLGEFTVKEQDECFVFVGSSPYKFNFSKEAVPDIIKAGILDHIFKNLTQSVEQTEVENYRRYSILVLRKLAVSTGNIDKYDPNIVY